MDIGRYSSWNGIEERKPWVLGVCMLLSIEKGQLTWQWSG